MCLWIFVFLTLIYITHWSFIYIFICKFLAFLFTYPSRLSSFQFSLFFVRTPDSVFLFKFSTSTSTFKSFYSSVGFIYHPPNFSVCHTNKPSSLGFYLFISLVSIWSKMNYLEISRPKGECFSLQHLECLPGQHRWIDSGIYYLFYIKACLRITIVNWDSLEKKC